LEDKRQRYLRGGLAYSDIKQELCELLLAKFDVGRQVYTNYLMDTDSIDKILKRGAEKARIVAGPLLSRIRHKVGIE